MELVSVSGITKTAHERIIVDNISFSQATGEKLAIAGDTGSGKSSVLKIIGGHMQADSGVVRIDNRRVIGPLDQLLPGHPGVVYLGQHFELRNNYWVHEILSYANELTEKEAKTLYDVCRISHLLNRKTNDGLSGGERQRIALARLLSTKPKLLLLDEPFSNLDIIHKQIIREVLLDITSKLHCTIMMVSHDPLDILSWADRLIILKDGAIVQLGDPKEVYEQPVNEYAAALLGQYNIILPGSRLHQVLRQTDEQADPLIIRPESLSIDPESSKTDEDKKIAGTVQHILYYGSYYLLEVKVDSQMIKIQTDRPLQKPGEEIIIYRK